MTESSEQRAIVAWFREKYSEHSSALRVSPGGFDFGYGAKAARKYRQMQSQGFQKGESDLVICLPRGGFGSLIIEHKGADQARKLTAEQSEYLEYHRRIGNMAECTRGIEEAQRVIESYMSLEGTNFGD